MVLDRPFRAGSVSPWHSVLSGARQTIQGWVCLPQPGPVTIRCSERCQRDHSGQRLSRPAVPDRPFWAASVSPLSRHGALAVPDRPFRARSVSPCHGVLSGARQTILGCVCLASVTTRRFSGARQNIQGWVCLVLLCQTHHSGLGLSRPAVPDRPFRVGSVCHARESRYGQAVVRG